MSTPNSSKGLVEDDEPEEGEIQDDDDDIVPPDNANCSVSCHVGKSPEDLCVSPRTKQRIERDIRQFESSRGRATRSRLSSGDSESYTMASTIRGNDSVSRRKDRRAKAGLTHGKENRHVPHSKPPHPSKGQYRKNLELSSSERCRDSSPLYRHSSQSSMDSDKASPDHNSYSRGRQKRFPKSGRGKWSSSSPDPEHNSSKRKPHHSLKCPLIKVLHSVAKETRLIARETAESNPTRNSLKKRLFNMGVIPQNGNTSSSGHNKSSAVGCLVEDSTALNNFGNLNDESSKAVSSLVQSSIGTDTIHTEDSNSEVTIIQPITKSSPEIVTLTDSDDGVRTPPERSCASCVCNKDVVSLDQENTLQTNYEAPAEMSTNLEGDPSLISPSEDIKASEVSSGDDEEDVGRLRFLALQSKKHEPTPPGDDDVLQLRLAALKTAIVKKFKGKKKTKVSSGTKAQCDINFPPSPLDDIPCFHDFPVDVDEATSPVDMDIAETDDEATEEIESAQLKSPVQDTFLQDLLPPPPPPDLPLHLFYEDQTSDCAMTGLCMLPVSQPDDILPPPLPQYFQELLETMPETPSPMPPEDFVVDSPQSVSCDPSCVASSLPTYVKKKSKSKKRTRVQSTSQTRLQSKTRPNLLEIPTSFKPRTGQSHQIERDTSPNNMDIDTMIVLDEIYDSSPIREIQNRSFEEVPHLDENVAESACLAELQDPKQSSAGELGSINSSGSPLRRTSLDEEEQLLRQRLLLNLANKQRSLAVSCENNNKISCDKIDQDSKKSDIESSFSIENQHKSVLSEKVSLNECCTVSPSSWYKQNPSNPQTTVSNEKRIIINLNEDSDSSVDYSEAEALGMMCVKNKEEWQRLVKDYDPNLFKSNVTHLPSCKSMSKTPVLKKQIAQSDRRPKSAEKVSDLETSIDRFLKGVRSSYDAKVSTPCSSTLTPVAVRHLPAPQQEEYRRLKQQIAELEKQKGGQHKKSNITNKPFVKTNSPIRGVSLNAPNNGLVKRLASGPNGKVSVVNFKRVFPSTSQISTQSKFSTTLKPKVLLSKPKPVMRNSLEPPKVASSKANFQGGTRPSIPLTKVKASGGGGNTLRITVPQINSKGGDMEPRREVSVSTNPSLVVSISTPTTTNSGKLLPTKSNPVSLNQLPLKSILSDQQSHKNLNNLEKELILERTLVLGELSALAKLLTQVDKSLEAQSHTATEVSNLLDQLCLAAGRWHAQNHTVTSLVTKVAQRQKVLSQGHQRCVGVSKSCAQLGSELHGKLYRIPSDKASSMHIYLKNVHEKTQALAKRRAREQDRKIILEKRAEKCLTKLFKDPRKVSLNGPKPPAKLQDAENGHTSAPNVVPSSLQSSISFKNPENIQEQHVENQKKNNDACSTKNNVLNVSSQLVPKILAYRIAQSKVRSSKALLTRCRKPLKGKRKIKLRRVEPEKNHQIHKAGQEELSDMDISSGGEDNENNQVVDMALSPVMSSSSDTNFIPTVNSLLPCSSPGSTKEVTLSSSTVICSKVSDCNKQKDMNIRNVSEVSKKKREEVVTIKDSTSNCLMNNTSTTLSNFSNIGVSSLQKRPVLKDYISPLGGLRASSLSSSSECHTEDPYAILCPYDLNGKCQDSDCPFKHGETLKQAAV